MVASPGDQITFDTLDGIVIWYSITKGAADFLDGIVVPVLNLLAANPIILLFLSVTFVSLGIGNIKRIIGSFGRGH